MVVTLVECNALDISKDTTQWWIGSTFKRRVNKMMLRYWVVL